MMEMNFLATVDELHDQSFNHLSIDGRVAKRLASAIHLCTKSNDFFITNVSNASETMSTK
jgi:hypothetical protein